MHPTPPLHVPVLTFLSRSPSASRRSLRLLERLTGIEPLDDDLSATSSANSRRRDALDASTFSSALLNRHSFDSVASQCPRSQVVIHLLSISNGEAREQSQTDANDDGNVLSLLSVTDDGSSSIIEADQSVGHSRNYISNHLKGGGGMLLGAQLAMRRRTDGRYPVEARHLLDGDVPKLDLASLAQYDENRDSVPCSQNQSKSAGIRGIREVVIPTFDGGVQSQLSSCSVLTRPKIGLYQWPGNNNNKTKGIIVRPLPSAAEDRELSPPSLVLQCDNLESCAERLRENDGSTDDKSKTAIAKVGFSGCGRFGQYMIRNSWLGGLDIRLCEATELSSSFAEAQEALLAASLDELQSVNVMNEGGDNGGRTKDGTSQQEGGSDAMNGLGDCWVEFRANLKKPGGFFGRKGGVGGGQRRKPEVAKAPDIPYE